MIHHVAAEHVQDHVALASAALLVRPYTRLRVAMPASVADARDLLISGTVVDDPVLYIDDRWLYELEHDIPQDAEAVYRGPRVVHTGSHVTFVDAG